MSRSIYTVRSVTVAHMGRLGEMLYTIVSAAISMLWRKCLDDPSEALREEWGVAACSSMRRKVGICTIHAYRVLLRGKGRRVSGAMHMHRLRSGPNVYPGPFERFTRYSKGCDAQRGNVVQIFSYNMQTQKVRVARVLLLGPFGA